MERLEGYVESVIFRNPENGYTVFGIESEGEEMTCVGTLPSVRAGEYIEVFGEYTTHPVYGTQMRVSSFLEKRPVGGAAVERYLSSGAVKGIGQTLAHRIVQKFGEDTFRIMEEEPERLAEVKGISLKMAQSFGAQMSDRRAERQAIVFLQENGVGPALSVRLYQTYGDEIYTIIRTNPYKIAEDLEGVGFRTADEIAARAGIEPGSAFRIRSGILYELSQASLEGHTFLPEEVLTYRSAQMLQVDPEKVRSEYMDLMMERKIVRKVVQTAQEADAPDSDAAGSGEGGSSGEAAQRREQVRMYAASFHTMETGTAQRLLQLNVTYDVPEEEILSRLSKIEAASERTMDPMQTRAVIEAARHGVFLLTGGPGTGKTTTINVLIRYFMQDGLAIALAAPTGRAAKRMSEMTGFTASTIHRLLEVSGAPGTISEFVRNEENPLEYDVIMIDEMSMVDISLMYALLKAVTVGTRLILVGDIDQLPSVGPGAVMKDILASGQFPSVSLTRIFRQAAQSDIVVNAHRINRGEEIALDNRSRDFFFLKRSDPQQILRVTLSLIMEKLPRYVNAEPSDIQVLSPMRKGVLGVSQLNEMLQKYLNPASPDKREKQYGDVLFREGDKVMQIRNDYQLAWEVRGKYGLVVKSGTGIFNGDIGIVREINEFASQMTVEFDDRKTVVYAYSQLDELEIAYAMTIHKSQGSEYPAVVLPLLGGPRMLLNRNLLYTAVTRAKRCVVIVGSEETFHEMVRNTSQQTRYSGLKEELQRQMPRMDPY